MPNQGYHIQGQPPCVPAGASTEAQIIMLLTASATVHYIPPHSLSRAEFSHNLHRGVLQNLPGGSVWTLTLQVDGSGLVPQLVGTKLHS